MLKLRLIILLNKTKFSKHININYLFIKDCVGKDLVKNKYCSANEKVKDFFTKLLQKLFCFTCAALSPQFLLHCIFACLKLSIL